MLAQRSITGPSRRCRPTGSASGRRTWRSSTRTGRWRADGLENQPLPLKGLRVIDWSVYWLAYLSMIHDLGAEVIKSSRRIVGPDADRIDVNNCGGQKR
jgi:hypothetical protein